MNRREASKIETRQLILTAARRLFAQKGMEESTIRDIAQQAGVSPASVLVHFKNKTALLEEALSGDIALALSEVIAMIPPDENLLVRLMHLAKGFFNFYDHNRNLYRALIRQTIFEPTGETPYMTRQAEQYIRFLSEIIEEEKQHGVIKPEVDAAAAALAIFSLYIGALIMLFRLPEMTVEQVAAVLTSMTGQYLQGIMASG
jgi:AcrR family transcriptional regulator